MKKILSILAFAAVVCVACTKGDNNGGTPTGSDYTTPQLPAPTNQSNHFTLTVDNTKSQPGMTNPSGNSDKVKGITVPPGTSGVVEFENDGPKSFNFVTSTKVSAGAVFTMDRVFQKMEVKSVDGNNMTLDVTVNGKVITLDGTIAPEPEMTPYRQDVCRNWIIEETILKVTGEAIDKDLGAGVRFNGCNLSEISKYLVEKKVKINTLGTEYDIRKIMIDPSGKFGILFQGKEPYYGDYTLKGTNFSYNFAFYEDDNPVLAGAATGKLTTTNGYGRLEIKSDLKDNSGKKYSVDVIFKMKSDKGE